MPDERRLQRSIQKSRLTSLLHMSAATKLGRTNCRVLISTVHQALVGLGKPGAELDR